jgi:hypothetical protein
LKSPPLIRKKTQTLTQRLKPKASAIYSKTLALGSPAGASAAIMLAICVAANAKNKNRNVPTNSPRKAMKWLRTLGGIHDRPGSGRAGGLSEVLAWVKGRTMGLSAGRTVFILGKDEDFLFSDWV